MVILHLLNLITCVSLGLLYIFVVLSPDWFSCFFWGGAHATLSVTIGCIYLVLWCGLTMLVIIKVPMFMVVSSWLKFTWFMR